MSLDQQLISFSIAATLNNQLDLQLASSPLSYPYSFGMQTGTGANQADKIFTDTRTIAASGTDPLDLNGVLIDPLGATLSLLRVKLLMIRAAAANTNNVLVGGAGSNQWATWISAATTNVIVRPGGALLLFAPDATAYGVTAATGDILQIANSGAGTSVTYDVVIIGASA
jgi:hypothetical protein